MKLTDALLYSVLTAAFAVSPALAQQSTATPPAQKPAVDDLPDAPTATAAVLTVPNGPTVVMDTSMGRITCQFFQRQAPNAVANFIGLATGAKDWTDPKTHKVQHHKPLYDGTTFHRVIPEFMIQGGDPIGTGMGDRQTFRPCDSLARPVDHRHVGEAPQGPAWRRPSQCTGRARPAGRGRRP